MVLYLFLFNYSQTQKRMPFSSARLMTIIAVIGTVFVINLEMFHGRISLNLMHLLLLNFGSGSRLKLMHISINVNMMTSLIYLHGF